MHWARNAAARYLLRLLDSSNEVAAQAALQRLYDLRSNIEWLDVVRATAVARLSDGSPLAKEGINDR